MLTINISPKILLTISDYESGARKMNAARLAPNGNVLIAVVIS